MRLWGGEPGRIIKRQKDRFYFVMMALQMYTCQNLSDYTFKICAMNSQLYLNEACFMSECTIFPYNQKVSLSPTYIVDVLKH